MKPLPPILGAVIAAVFGWTLAVTPYLFPGAWQAFVTLVPSGLFPVALLLLSSSVLVWVSVYLVLKQFLGKVDRSVTMYFALLAYLGIGALLIPVAFAMTRAFSVPVVPFVAPLLTPPLLSVALFLLGRHFLEGWEHRSLVVLGLLALTITAGASSFLAPLPLGPPANYTLTLLAWPPAFTGILFVF